MTWTVALALANAREPVVSLKVTLETGIVKPLARSGGTRTTMRTMIAIVPAKTRLRLVLGFEGEVVGADISARGAAFVASGFRSCYDNCIRGKESGGNSANTRLAEATVVGRPRLYPVVRGSRPLGRADVPRLRTT